MVGFSIQMLMLCQLLMKLRDEWCYFYSKNITEELNKKREIQIALMREKSGAFK